MQLLRKTVYRYVSTEEKNAMPETEAASSR